MKFRDSIPINVEFIRHQNIKDMHDFVSKYFLNFVNI